MPPIDEGAYPAALRTAEDALVAQRRREARVDPEAPRLGLALSGGGLRSATFCLGFCQALARLGLLRRVDYLSTVSGGGYCGALIGGLFHADRGRAATAAPATPAPGADETEKTLAATNSPVIQWLRESGRYLAPNGSGDVLLAAAAAFRARVTY